MTHLIPVTHDRKRANGEIVNITEWTTGCYTLRHTYEEKWDYNRWEIISADRGIPNIYVNEPLPGEGPITTGVNWSAMGTRPADEARNYGTHLIMAAHAAEAFQQIITEFEQNA